MSGNRRLWLLLGLVLLLIAGLVVFYLWLTGDTGTSQDDAAAGGEGLVPISTIYFYADNRPIIKPVGLGSDSTGNFFVTLRDASTVVEFTRAGTYVRHFGERGIRPGNLMTPIGVAVDRLADQVYVVDRARLRLIAFDGSGAFLWEVPVLGPTSVAVDDDGDVLVSTFGPLARFSSQGELLAEIGSRGRSVAQFDFPRQIVPGPGDTVFVADSLNRRVSRVDFSRSGTPTIEWIVGTPPQGAEDPTGRFLNPTGIALSPRGLVVTLDAFGHTIEMLDPATGDSLTDFGGERRGTGDGAFNLPTMITNLAGDEYAVADTYNDRVQIIRLIEPGRRNPFTLYPWLRWLLLLLLLPLLWLFGRKRAFVPSETLDRALGEGKARLLIAVFNRLYVLPSVFKQYEERIEGDVRLGDYLVPVEVTPRVVRVKKGEPEPEPERIEDLTPEEQLARAAERTAVQKLLLARHFVVGVNEAQCERFAEIEVPVMPYEQVLEEYEVEGGGSSDTGSDDAGSETTSASGAAPEAGTADQSDDS